jgi:hypothetical protein
MSFIAKGLNELREQMEWEGSQHLIDALAVALEEDLAPGTNPLGVALRAIHRDSVGKAFVAIINGGVLPVNRASDNAQILEFLKELTGDL